MDILFWILIIYVLSIPISFRLLIWCLKTDAGGSLSRQDTGTAVSMSLVPAFNLFVSIVWTMMVFFGTRESSFTTWLYERYKEDS